MTTLQTLSTRNQDSASSVVQRAQTNSLRADDAPGFAGVFSEILNEFPGSESGNAEQTDDSENAETQPGTENGQDNLGKGAPRVKSVGDLAGLLTNAAMIDVAALATQELQGLGQNSAKAQANQIREDGARSDSAQSKTELLAKLAASRAGHNQEPAAAQNQQTSTRTLAQGTEAAVNSSDTKPEASKPSALDQANQKQTAVQQSVESQQSLKIQNPQPPQSTQMAQVAQAITADTSRNARPLEGLRSINEIAGFSGKSRAVMASDSSGSAGSDQSGLDLGNRSKNTSKILQTKQPDDDRAVQRQQVMAQVQRGLASIMNTKGGSMKLRLSPEHLGEVNIQLMTKDGHVSVKIDAKNDETREMLKDGLEALRSAMESRGVRVDDLSVQGRQQTDFQRMFGDTGQEASGHQQNPSDSRNPHPHPH
ncbi:MAG: flagellar hook-length control protein FliK, partial [Phycisphaerales bacterium]|nr:flagellar hook-length control protein FliK [Phycisphaerales bacterium]